MSTTTPRDMPVDVPDDQRFREAVDDAFEAPSRSEREAVLERHPEWREAILTQIAVHDLLCIATGSTAPGADRDTLPGTPLRAFGRYSVGRPHGRGGMGVVYRVHDDRLDRTVALKHLDRLVDDDSRERFLREARVLARVRHPNVCTIFDYGEQDGHPFFVMDFCEGDSLAERLERGPLGTAEAVRIVARIAGALAAIHGDGIVHRDLKPRNVMFDGRPEDEPIVVDFGLARPLEALETGLTRTGAVVGTFRYMSPEQGRGESEIGPATDVYSLGVMLREMVTGERPTETSGEAIPESATPARLRSLRTLWKTMTQPEPEDRPSSAEVADTLERWLNGRWSTRVRLAVAAAVLLVASTVTFATYAMTTNGVIYVDVDPADASLYVDGQLVTAESRTDDHRSRVIVPRGAASLRLEREGFVPQTRPLAFSDTFGRRFVVDLQTVPEPRVEGGSVPFELRVPRRLANKEPHFFGPTLYPTVEQPVHVWARFELHEDSLGVIVNFTGGPERDFRNAFRRSLYVIGGPTCGAQNVDDRLSDWRDIVEGVVQEGTVVEIDATYDGSTLQYNVRLDGQVVVENRRKRIVEWNAVRVAIQNAEHDGSGRATLLKLRIWQGPPTWDEKPRFPKMPGWVPARGRVTPQHEGVELYERGSIVTTREFAPPLDLRFRWSWDGAAGIDSDNLGVVLGTSGEHMPERAWEIRDGVKVEFESATGKIHIGRMHEGTQTRLLGEGFVERIGPSEPVDVRITDNGRTINVYVGDGDTAVATADVEQRGPRGHIAIYNREFTSGARPRSHLSELRLSTPRLLAP